MSQAKDRPSPCSIRNIRIRKILGLNDCSLRGPPSDGSPQEAGGQPKTELHSPPPLPHDSRGCDHHHCAPAVMTQTGSFKIDSGDFYFGVIFTSVDTKNIPSVLTLCLQPRLSRTILKDFSFKF